MIRTRSEKGITLIALIITIIVLLILAVVAIGAVTNDGIINYAKNARDQYGEEQVRENTTLQNYLDIIKENVPTGTGTTTGTGTNNGNGEEVAETIIFYYEKILEFIANKNESWESWINRNAEGAGDFRIINRKYNPW